MTIDLTNVLTWRDVFLGGVIVGMVIASRGRRRQGERLGKVEQTHVRLEAVLETIAAKLIGPGDPPSGEGKPR